MAIPGGVKRPKASKPKASKPKSGGGPQGTGHVRFYPPKKKPQAPARGGGPQGTGHVRFNPPKHVQAPARGGGPQGTGHVRFNPPKKPRYTPPKMRMPYPEITRPVTSGQRAEIDRRATLAKIEYDARHNYLKHVKGGGGILGSLGRNQTVHAFTHPKEIIKALDDLSHKHAQTQGGSYSPKSDAAVIAAKQAYAIGHETVKHPGAVASATGRSVPKLLVGALPGLVEAAADPVKAGKGLAKDFKARYPKTEKEREAAVRRYGLIPYALDAGAATAVAGRTLGAGLRRAPKGSRRRAFMTKPRPQLRVSSGVVKKQDLSHNAAVVAAQRGADYLRAKAHAHEKAAGGTLRPVRPGIKEVRPIDVRGVPHRLKKTVRLQHKHVAERKGRALLVHRTKLAAELGAAGKNIRSLNKHERAGFRFALEHGVRSPEHAAMMIPARIREILEHRQAAAEAGHPIQVKGGPDEAAHLAKVLANTHKTFTPKLGIVANTERDRARRLAAADPGLGPGTAELRRTAVQAKALGLERGVIPYRQKVTPKMAAPKILKQEHPDVVKLKRLAVKLDARIVAIRAAGQKADRANLPFLEEALRQAKAKIREAKPVEHELAPVAGAQELPRSVPKLRYTEEHPTDFAARVGEAARNHPGGPLAEPGYFRHDLLGMQDAERHALTHGSGSAAVVGPKHTDYKLHAAGTASSDPLVHLKGMAANLKRTFNWNFVADSADQYVMSGTRNKTIPELVDYAKKNNIDLNEVAFWNPKQYARDREQSATDVHGLDSPDDGGLGQVAIGAARDNSLYTFDRLRTAPGEFQQARGWSLIPKPVHDEIFSSTRPEGLLGRSIAKFGKSYPSKIILGSNPSWALIQVLNNTMLAALAGVGPSTVVRANRFFAKNPELRDATDPYIGTSPFQSEMYGTKLGSTASGSITQMLRTLGDSRVGQFMGRHNPLDILFKFDHAANNNQFRRAILYNDLKRESFRRMGESMGMSYRITQQMKHVFTLGPKEQMAALAKESPQLERAAVHVDEMLGNYTTYTAAERRILERNVMFYGFLRFSLRFAFLTMPLHHPIMASIAAHLSQLHEDEVRNLIGLGPDDPLPPGALASAYFNGGRTEIPLQRLNPAANVLTQGLDPNNPGDFALGTLSGAVSPLWASLANQVAGKNLYFNKGYTVDGEKLPRETKENPKKYGMGNRAQIFGHELATMFAPLRFAEKRETGGAPVSSDSYLGHQNYQQYLDLNRATAIGVERQRELNKPFGRSLLEFLGGIVPRESHQREIAQSYVQKLRDAEGLPRTLAGVRQEFKLKHELRAKDPAMFQAVQHQQMRNILDYKMKQARKKIDDLHHQRQTSVIQPSTNSPAKTAMANTNPSHESVAITGGDLMGGVNSHASSAGGGDFGGGDFGGGDFGGKKGTITAAANAAGISPALLWGVYGAESNFGKNKNNSSAGAQGPFQFMPATAAKYGINPHNFKQAAYAAARELAQYKSRGTAGMLAAYNAGPAGNPHNAETAAYIPKVQRLAGSYGVASARARTSSAGSITIPGQIPIPFTATQRVPVVPTESTTEAAIFAALLRHAAHPNSSLGATVLSELQSPSNQRESPSPGLGGQQVPQVQSAVPAGLRVALGGSAVSGGQIAELVRRANKIDSERLPYQWGGGHGARPAGPGVPVDCSGAVARLLGINPRVSGQFASWGAPGRGKNFTVYANGTHVFVEIAGHFWGTSRANPGGGAGWIPKGAISASYLRNFTARHIPGH